MSPRLESLWYPDRAESGAQRLLRAPLSLASLGFGAAVRARGALYDRGVLPSRRIEGARVISVGNLTVGGAGKTPVVIHLAQRLLARGVRVAVQSRGYGRAEKRDVAFDAQSAPGVEEAGDEPLLVARRCPGARVYVGGDRAALAQRARDEGAQVILLDDGLQHRRLARDADVVVVDEAVGLGNGALLPRGPLREPPEALRRASLLWVRASDRPAPLPPFAGPVVRARHAPDSVLAPDGELHPPERLRGMHVHALCAIARPASFERTLRALGASVAGMSAYPDHHRFRAVDVAAAERAAVQEGALLVTTEKDHVRLPPGAPAWVVRLGVTLLSGGEHLDALLAPGTEPR